MYTLEAAITSVFMQYLKWKYNRKVGFKDEIVKRGKRGAPIMSQVLFLPVITHALPTLGIFFGLSGGLEMV